jgi:hypothetical protein
MRVIRQWLSGGLVATLLLQADVAAQDFASQQAQWAESAPADYEYRYQRVCECHPDQPADTIVTVRDGRITAVRYARPDYASDVPVAADRLSWFRTIDDLFALLASARERDALVRATFDADYGFPRTVYIDYITDLVGDEVRLTITGFTPSP